MIDSGWPTANSGCSFKAREPMAVLKTTFNFWSVKADSAEKSAQDQVMMVAELNTHLQLFPYIKVKALFGTVRSGMGVLNVEELESLEHPARQQPHLPRRSYGNTLKAGIRWSLFLSRTFITPLLPPADTKVNTAQEGTFWYKIVCMLKASPVSISRNQGNTCESEIWECWVGGDKAKYKVG